MLRFTTVAALGLIAGLAACTSPTAPANDAAANTAAANAAAPAGDTLARMAQLAPAQQQLVVFRAIRDAGQECQGITDFERGPEVDGRATWRATCRGAQTWSVAIGNDGVAQVTGPLTAGRP